MEGRAYDKSGVAAVIVKIDTWLAAEDPDILTFKNEVVQYLEANESLDDASFQWALDQIDGCKINQTENIKDFLEELRLCLRIDRLIEEGRECLIRNEGYGSWIDDIIEVLAEYRPWNEEACDRVLESLPTKYKDVVEAVYVIREYLEGLKLEMRGM
jgi:hypothetical protein